MNTALRLISSLYKMSAAYWKPSNKPASLKQGSTKGTRLLWNRGTYVKSQHGELK